MNKLPAAEIIIDIYNNTDSPADNSNPVMMVVRGYIGGCFVICFLWIFLRKSLTELFASSLSGRYQK